MSVIVGGHWTYSGNPAASDKDAVRHLLGDTNEDDQQLSDEEIEWEIDNAGGSVRTAASRAARSLGSRYSLQPSSKKVGDLAITYGDRSAAMSAIADALSDDTALVAVPIGGGISWNDKQNEERRTDRVPPSFKKGLMDDPGLGWPDSQQSSTSDQFGY
jgi:hypothetical protein